MNEHSSKKPVSEADLEVALGAFARDPAALMPESEEEVLALYQALDPAKLPTPNVRRFEKLLEAERKGQAQSHGVLAKLKRLIPQATSPDPMVQPAPVVARKGKKDKSKASLKMEAAKKARREQKKKERDQP